MLGLLLLSQREVGLMCSSNAAMWWFVRVCMCDHSLSSFHPQHLAANWKHASEPLYTSLHEVVFSSLHTHTHRHTHFSGNHPSHHCVSTEELGFLQIILRRKMTVFMPGNWAILSQLPFNLQIRQMKSHYIKYLQLAQRCRFPAVYKSNKVKTKLSLHPAQHKLWSLFRLNRHTHIQTVIRNAHCKSFSQPSKIIGPNYKQMECFMCTRGGYGECCVNKDN